MPGTTLLSAFTLALGIGLQNFPEGSSVSLPLRREGYSRKKAFFYGQLSGIVEPISAVIGALLVLSIKTILPFLLAFAAGAMIYVVTGSPSGDTAKNVADKVFFVPAAVYRGTDDVVPSFQPMGNLFEQCLLILFDIIIMTIVDETPGLTFEKMSKNHRNVE